MSFDLHELTAALAHGAVIRVVLAETRGSVPREAGTAMLVVADRQFGTIGGGALEYEATRRARAMLVAETPWEVWSLPLGPSLGQCCGGAVIVLAERFVEAPEIDQFPRAVPVTAPPGIKPPGVAKAQAGMLANAKLVQGWLVEPLAKAEHPLWLWGAGHVGRAIAHLVAPLPDHAVTWIDDAADRFPSDPPAGVTCLPAPGMAAAMALAPSGAHHLILTYSHDIDLALCHAALAHGFASCGLIGSATKWARFRKRLQAFGHAPAQIAHITCPIGDRALGKHPQAIAIGVVARHVRGLSAVGDACAETWVG